MKHFVLFVSIAIAFVAVSCSQGEKESKTEEKTEVQKTTKPEEKKITVERYSKVANELRALLMEKYWDKFKDKSYSEVKEIYAQYKKEEDAIYEKHGVKDPSDMDNFFRSNFSEIEEYQKNNPEYKDYPEYQDAKMKLGTFAMKKAME